MLACQRQAGNRQPCGVVAARRKHPTAAASAFADPHSACGVLIHCCGLRLFAPHPLKARWPPQPTRFLNFHP